MGQVVKQLGVVSLSDVLAAQEYNEIDLEFVEKMYGGNFLSGLKHVFSKAQRLKSFVKKGSKIARDL